MFAIIRTGGKQYKVQEGTWFQVEKLDAQPGETVTISDVLLISDGDKTIVGAPTVKGASVTAEVLDQDRDETVLVFKKRRRQNSRRKNGHRQYITTIKITGIKAA